MPMREFYGGRAEYHVDIACMRTGQRIFIGCHDGPLAPLLEGIMECAKVLDAGKTLRRKRWPRPIPAHSRAMPLGL